MPYVGNVDGSFNGVRYQEDKVVPEGGPLSREDLEYLASDEYQKLRWEDQVSDEQIGTGVYVGADGYAYDTPQGAGADDPDPELSGEAVITRAHELGIEPGAPAEESDEPDFTEQANAEADETSVATDEGKSEDAGE